MLQKLLKRPLFRYIFVGGLAYIVDIGVLIGVYSGLHAQRAVAASASFWAGLLFSFAMQKFVAFQDFQKEMKAISRQIAWYIILVGFNYTLTVFIVSLFPGKDIVYSRTLAVAVTTIWNFLVYKRIIFRNNNAPRKSPK